MPGEQVDLHAAQLAAPAAGEEVVEEVVQVARAPGAAGGIRLRGEGAELPLERERDRLAPWRLTAGLAGPLAGRPWPGTGHDERRQDKSEGSAHGGQLS